MRNKLDKDILEKLWNILRDRKRNMPNNSYVASLYQEGNEKINQKIIEEAKEYVEAISHKEKSSIIHEAADVWFHTLVSMSLNDIDVNDILLELEKRFGTSGIEEKKSREK